MLTVTVFVECRPRLSDAAAVYVVVKGMFVAANVASP
jgi:hypothetical protein